ncbi:MAG: chorismate synthase [Roseburia sp.]|nr:chorismate synthase [Roseburia sp.]
MAGSTLGTIFKITTWGESHGRGIGVVIDGCPAGLDLCEEDIQVYLNRRKPGQSRYSTPRKEEDAVEILSGVFEGKTTGSPISLWVQNQNQNSKDYSEIAGYYRPGHADYTFDAKYGFRDYRGGGRSSGRETISRVAAGAVAAKILKKLGITVTAYTKSIGPVTIQSFDPEAIFNNPLFMPDADAAKQSQMYLNDCMRQQDSAGGIVECQIHGVPAGMGDPVFEKLDANLARAIMSIGAVKGFEMGDGFTTANSRGSLNNDSFHHNADGEIQKATNHSGGVLGGISDGDTILFRAAIKPTPSISALQKTVKKSGEDTEISIKGRHDPVIVPRAVVVVECMAALTLLDALLLNMTATVQGICDFYQK